MSILSIGREYPVTNQTKPHPIVNRISVLAKSCFETIKTTLTFPFRYLGSKTWSIPGAILRLPVALFQRLFGKPTTPLFNNKYHTRFEKTLTPEELEPYFPYACAAAFPHAAKLDYILPGWKLVSPLSLNLAVGSIESMERYFFDPNTYLKASLLEKEDELILSFAAIKNLHYPFLTKCRISKDIIQPLLGFHPEIFEQASDLVVALRKIPHLQNKKLTLTGECFGAALASYAALKNQLPAVGFNSFPLGAGQQYQLGKKRLEEADNYITHISVKTDLVSDVSRKHKWFDSILSGIGIRTPGHFGHRFLIPSVYQKAVETHIFPLCSVMRHLGYDARTKPSALTSYSKHPLVGATA